MLYYMYCYIAMYCYLLCLAGSPIRSFKAKLAQGLHVVLSPGIYDLTEPLVMFTNNQARVCKSAESIGELSVPNPATLV